MQVYCSGNTGIALVVLFEYQPTRLGEHARRFLGGFHGWLQTDYADKLIIPMFTASIRMVKNSTILILAILKSLHFIRIIHKAF